MDTQTNDTSELHSGTTPADENSTAEHTGTDEATGGGDATIASADADGAADSAPAKRTRRRTRKAPSKAAAEPEEPLEPAEPAATDGGGEDGGEDDGEETGEGASEGFGHGDDAGDDDERDERDESDDGSDGDESGDDAESDDAESGEDESGESDGDDATKKKPKKKRDRKEMRRERFGVQTTLEPPPFGPSVMLVEESVGDECRVAVLEEGRLSHYFAERESTSTNVGSIYKGRVANVEPAIQAAFIDFGQGQNGFLHVSDLHPKYFPGGEVTERVGKKIARRDRPMIQDALKRGQEIIVQVIKEGIGTKGPTVTSYISIPGRLLVMMPDMDKAGVSRKVEDEDQRRAMRKILDSLDLPSGCGFILRTAGLDRSKSELQRDAAYLQRLWEAMTKRIQKTGGPCELYTEGDLLIRTLRDLADPCIHTIVVDTPNAFERAQIFMDIVAPGTGPKLRFWNQPSPLFTAFRVEEQVAMIHAREVRLPSGGALVFDEAEALVAIDVNSGRSRSAKDSETNAYQTNLEAVEEISRQLRLRDVGGLIINDLIDMRLSKHRRAVEERFAALLKRDRAKTTLLPISELGMAEMTRQRMRPSQRKANYTACPHCQGAGEVRMPDVVVSDIIRQCSTLLAYPQTRRVEAVCSVRVASEMLGRGRRLINAIEERSGKLVDVRISEAFAVDRFEVYAYDERGADIEIERLPSLARPRVDELPGDLPEAAEAELDAELAESPRRRRRRRKPAPADATAIALAGGFDDLPEIDTDESPLLDTIQRREREEARSTKPSEGASSREGRGGASRRDESRRGERKSHPAGGSAGESRGDDRAGDRAGDRSGDRGGDRGDDRSGDRGDGGRRRRNRRHRGPQQAVLVPGEPVPLDRCETRLLARHYGLTPEELLAKLREIVPADLERFVTLDRQMLPCEVIHYVRLHFTPAPADVAGAAAIQDEVERPRGTAALDVEDGGVGGEDGDGHGQPQGEERSGRRRRRRRRRGRGEDRQGAAEGAEGPSRDADGDDRDDRGDRGGPPAAAAPEVRSHGRQSEPTLATASPTQDSPSPTESAEQKPAWKPLRSLYGAAMRRLRPGEPTPKRE